MLSFNAPIDYAALSADELSYLNELLRDTKDMFDEECEISYAVSNLCLIPRIFELGKYSFIFPIALSERANGLAALFEVNEYAMREEIERVFTFVPWECLSLFTKHFRHLDIDAEDFLSENFRVKIKTECELLEKIPSFDFGTLSLTEISENDFDAYARLVRNVDVNKYWGYDFRTDFSENVPDSFFIENARLEFARGTALALAVRDGDKFIGEIALYAFDGMGGAEFAIRLLPEYQGLGLASRALEALFEYSKTIGLTRLFAFVDKRNAPSLKFCARHMEKCSEDNTRVKFCRDVT